jgi:hypothetical protein
MTNAVLAGFAVICLGHESHTAGQSCRWSQPDLKRLSRVGVGVFSLQQAARPLGLLTGAAPMPIVRPP